MRTRRRARQPVMDALSLATLGGAVLTFGCASYHPMPASPQSIAAAIAPLDPPELARQAASLRHALLPPITIAPDGSLSPQGAAVVAVLQNPSLRAVRDRRGVGAAQVLEAGILPNPQLSYSMDRPFEDRTIAGEETVAGFGVGVSWDVTALIARNAKRSSAARSALSIDLDTAWQEWQTALAAKLHATRVLWLSRRHDELASQADEALNLANRSEDNVRAGLITFAERDAAAALLQRRRSALLASDAALRSELMLARESIGLPGDAPLRIVADADLAPGAPPSPEGIGATIEESRLDLAALRAGYDAQEEKLRAAVLSQFPKINLGINRARDTSDIGTVGFGITLDLPIFDRGQGRIAIETATRQQLFDELAARTFEARADAARAYDELDAVEPQIAEADRTVDRLTTLVRSIEAARREGDADIALLNQARTDLADARIESLRLRQQQAELRIAVEVATGRLLGTVEPPENPQ